jgi:hypothetical protein
MTDFQQALALQESLEEVAERIKEMQIRRSYLTPDSRAYVLAFGGDGAQVLSDFMEAVGQYLMKVKNKRTDKDAARVELLRAFDEWLSKQKISTVE